MNKVGSKELSKHVDMKPKPNWQFKIVLRLILLFSTYLFSLIGALTIGRALMGIITLTSMIIPVTGSAWTIFNLGTVIITLYVLYRLYRFHDYIFNKVYLFIVNELALIRIAKQDQKHLEKETN